jgi:hypothetical protein
LKISLLGFSSRLAAGVLISAAWRCDAWQLGFCSHETIDVEYQLINIFRKLGFSSRLADERLSGGGRSSIRLRSGSCRISYNFLADER